MDRFKIKKDKPLEVEIYFQSDLTKNVYHYNCNNYKIITNLLFKKRFENLKKKTNPLPKISDKKTVGG